MDQISYPGARRPDRRRRLLADGLGLSVWEWGDEEAPPVLLAHGGFDFAGTFDCFAPLLADAGWRVVSWDHRGHGDSDTAALYSWEADVRDALAVLDSATRGPAPFIGHSKGGGLLMQLADARPHRCSHLVNLDGLPSRRDWPDVADHERTRLLAGEVAGWLDRRRVAGDQVRKPGTIDELAARRQRMNPRLPIEWLRYLVTIGAREDEDGWRWKLDPVMRPGGFGPWRPEWSIRRMPGLPMPVLGVLGLVMEPMGWGTTPKDVEAWLPPGGELVTLDDSGHFVHIEHPERVAELVLDFLGPPPSPGSAWAPVVTGTDAPEPAPSDGGRVAPPTLLRHVKVDLALHHLRRGDGPALLLLHGLAERSAPSVPASLASWPGPVAALDFTGHGDSTVPLGGGYTAEVLMGDADIALAHLGTATVLGRGLGAWIALLLCGARPGQVLGAILADGPGLAGGGDEPGGSTIVSVPPGALAPPDPFALGELAHDVRPRDYATSFVRLAVQGSPLEHPVAVVAQNRPAWLAAVSSEPGVVETTLPDALASYASIQDWSRVDA